MDPVVHFEIPTDDQERARAFYSQAFGWEISTRDPQYYLLNTAPTDAKMWPKDPGAINGGMMKRRHPGERPLIVIRVQEMEAALARVKEAGGSAVFGPINIGVGVYAHVQDTEGNAIALFQDQPRD